VWAVSVSCPGGLVVRLVAGWLGKWMAGWLGGWMVITVCCWSV
jgi:hypothetical protein